MQYRKTFRQLIVWKEAKKLSIIIYKITKIFPKEELYALSSQLKRSSYSILANIAEGNARSTKKDRIHFFRIAQSSLIELDALLELSLDLGFVTKQNYNQTTEYINKTAYLLNNFINAQS